MKHTLLILALFPILVLSCTEKKDAPVELTMETALGTIELRLYDETPLHRDNFKSLALEGAFDSLLFHRVIKDFMIQGGDPDSKYASAGVMLGEGDKPYTVPAEFRLEDGIYHKRGVLAAARENDDVNPEQASSAMQFYIVWGRVFDDEGIQQIQDRLDQRTGGKVKLTPEMIETYKTIGGTPHLDGQYTVFGEVTCGLDVVEAIQNSATDENDRPLEDVRILKVREKKMKLNLDNFSWTREPASCTIDNGTIEVVTAPGTDLWQRTYYHFRNDNAPVFQMETAEKYFSFIVKTDFTESHHRFDQCGVVMYLDSENWLKGSVEYENEEFQHLGSVVTNNGYSDWATTAISADVKQMWYRLSRRNDDFCIECSQDGINFSQMRVCHVYKATDKVQFGIYACSPEDSSFKAVFTNLQLTDCAWKAHDGQQADY